MYTIYKYIKTVSMIASGSENGSQHLCFSLKIHLTSSCKISKYKHSDCFDKEGKNTTLFIGINIFVNIL